MELPWLLQNGAVVGPLLLLGLAVASPLTVVAGRLLRARRVAVREATRRFGAPESPSPGRRTLRGRIEATENVDGFDGRIRGVVASSRAQETSFRAPGLALRVGDHVLPLRGSVEVMLGSRRIHLRLPRPRRVDWLRDGDEVMAQGEVVADWDAGAEGYRDQTRAFTLEATAHTPVRLMAVERPRAWGFVVPSTLAVLASISMLAASLVPMMLAMVASTLPVYDQEADRVTAAAVLASLSPLSRRGALRQLVVALDEPKLAASLERDGAQRALVAEVDDPRLAAWLDSRHGRWREAAEAARMRGEHLRAGWYAWAAGDVEAASAAFAEVDDFGEEEALWRAALTAHLLAGRTGEVKTLGDRWDRVRRESDVVRDCAVSAGQDEAWDLTRGWIADDDVRYACFVANDATDIPAGLRPGAFSRSALGLAHRMRRGDWPLRLLRDDGLEDVAVHDEPRATVASRLAYPILVEALDVPLPSPAQRLDEVTARIAKVDAASRDDRSRVQREELERLFAPWVVRLLVLDEAVMALHGWGLHAQARALMDRGLGWARRLGPAARAIDDHELAYAVDDKWLGKLLRVLNLTRATDLMLRLRRGEPLAEAQRRAEAPWEASHILQCLRGLPDAHCEANEPSYRWLSPSDPLAELLGSHPHLARPRLPLRIALAGPIERQRLTSFLAHGPRWWDLALTPLAWAEHDCGELAVDCPEGNAFAPVGDPFAPDVRDGAFVLGMNGLAQAEQERHARLHAAILANPRRAFIAAVATSAR